MVSYTVVVSGDLVRGFTVTNSHTPKETPPEPKRPDVPNTAGSGLSG
ncbi:MAG: hypothetical protein Q4F09_00840 [Erysipelotrichaceae bacterium]|nr:hypothetical protein [Erysipelotrichaceae bacterium]